MAYETVWSFKTARFEVRLRIEPIYGYQYEGDDEDGEQQRLIDEGVYTAFASEVEVLFDGRVIGDDQLYGSVYETMSDFWTDHRTSTFEGRNTLALKAKNTRICHYFPSMVYQATAHARATLKAEREVYIRDAA